MNAVNIKITNLHPNTGQIPGVPANPRFIKDESYEKLKQSIIADPEMLDLRELLVYPHPDKAGHFIIIGGNMRYRICKELKYKTVPCKEIPKKTPANKLRAILTKDNVSFGSFDFDMLANDWDAGELEAWGVDIPDFDEDKGTREAWTVEPSLVITFESPKDLQAAEIDILKILEKKYKGFSVKAITPS